MFLIIRLSLFVLLLNLTNLSAYTLSVCALFQDEAPYLKEWIEFHRLVGVEHFYLYNHRSQDDYLTILEPYLKAGIIELAHIDKPAETIQEFLDIQTACYTNSLNQALGKSQWVAFIDVDEYLLPMQSQNLHMLLKEFDYAGGIGVNWLMFGTSGVKKIEANEMLIEKLTCCAAKNYSPNRYIKSIVQVSHASHFSHPHYPVYKPGFAQVNTDHLEFEGQFSTYIRTNRLRINHYWTKDECFFYNQKIPRQKKWGGTPVVKQLLEQMNACSDKEILRFAPALKIRLNNATSL